jgi:O-antigen ligase
MAGMEIFGWLTFALTMSYAFRTRAVANAPSPANTSQQLSLCELVTNILPWKLMIIWYALVILGVFFTGTPANEKLHIFGSHRWMFLLIANSFALSLCPPTTKGYRVFLAFTGIIAVYAIFQSFTGIDLLRMHDANPHRAVQFLDVRKDIQLWRSAGLFGSPMGYVYIAGIHSCLALAVALVFPREQSKLRRWSLLVFILIAASLVTTYVRGGWFSITVAVLVMTWLANRRFFLWAIGLGAGAFAILFLSLVQFRERFMSLLDPQYASNSERMNLWKMNVRVFLDHPIFGIGWEMNEVRACEYVNCQAIPRPFTGHAHNNYLQALSGLGITGLAAYLAFIGFFLWATYRLWKRLPENLYWARALTLAAFGAQIHLHLGGLTECNWKAGATNHNIMVALAIVVSLTYLEKKGALQKRHSDAGTSGC